MDSDQKLKLSWLWCSEYTKCLKCYSSEFSEISRLEYINWRQLTVASSLVLQNIVLVWLLSYLLTYMFAGHYWVGCDGRMVNLGRCASFSSLIGRNKEFPSPEKDSSTLLVRYIRPRNSSVRTDQSPFSAGACRSIPRLSWWKLKIGEPG